MPKRPITTSSIEGVTPKLPRYSLPLPANPIDSHRNDFSRLPLELREQIFAHLFDDLTAEPRHPYGDLPLNSRFRTYAALRLTDRATNTEAERVFRKQYAQRIVFYFEDACTLYDCKRRAERIPFPGAGQFVLRTRTDNDPRRDLDDWIRWMNRVLINSNWSGNYADARTTAYPDLHGDIVCGVGGDPLPESFQVTKGDHAGCDGTEPCIPYQLLHPPAHEGTFDHVTAIWRMQVLSKWSARQQRMISKSETVTIEMFSGRLCDLSFKGFSICAAKRRLIGHLSGLAGKPWAKFLDRYAGHYPRNEKEYSDFVRGATEYDWPRSDIGLDERSRDSASDTTSEEGTFDGDVEHSDFDITDLTTSDREPNSDPESGET
ncbi:unnamed protein product [Zymoseptoria tritici ST99CH_1E4]|uniref:Uncharacterized protein n=1 Tax=Zymoseptoria tritici ST99CH_1E4 TaxID=1276532 RepID=A0A2H1GXA4_ZYMTR|nr:unnamed protein product [Zymoseptoria tritici ST99CH_1E4]